MCCMYRIKGNWIEILENLYDYFPKENIIFHEGYDLTDKEKYCLCPVDAWATAKKNNVRIVQSAGDYYFGDEECEKEIEYQKKQGELGWFKDSDIDGYEE